MFERFRSGLELDSAPKYESNTPLRKVWTLYYTVWKPLRMSSSAKHVVLLCLKFTFQEFFQISLFTATRIILMNTFHRHTVWRLLSMAAVTACTGGWWLSMRYSRSARRNNKRTHIIIIIITTTDWKQSVLTMLSFILNPVHFPRTLLVFKFSLGTPQTSLCFMSVSPSLTARSAAAANSVRADFGVFRLRVITLRFYTEICLW